MAKHEPDDWFYARVFEVEQTYGGGFRHEYDDDGSGAGDGEGPGSGDSTGEGDGCGDIHEQVGGAGHGYGAGFGLWHEGSDGSGGEIDAESREKAQRESDARAGSVVGRVPASR